MFLFSSTLASLHARELFSLFFFFLEYASPTLWPFRRCPSSCPISSAKQRLPFFTRILSVQRRERAASRHAPEIFFTTAPRLVSSKTSGFLNRREDIHVLGDHVISCTSARARISETQLPEPYSVSFLKRSVYYLFLSFPLCGFSNSPCFPLFRPRFSNSSPRS